jgi:hypothetical protein
MASSKNRLLEVILFAPVHRNLYGATIESQRGDKLIVKLAESKPRTKKASATPRKPRVKKTDTAVVPEVASA